MTKERVENGTNGFSLIGIQILCLHRFCSTLIGGSGRRFRLKRVENGTCFAKTIVFGFFYERKRFGDYE